MNYYVGIDVSLEFSSVCVVDGTGKIAREAKVASEPEALIAWFGSLGLRLERIGLEAGAIVAVALCGAAGGGACGRTVGDAAREGGVVGDAGEDGPQ